jgi:hypothetical protein
MPPSPPVGEEGWGEAGAAPAILFVPGLGAHQLMHGQADFLPAVPDGDAAYTKIRPLRKSLHLSF